MDRPAVEVSALCKRYGTTLALDGVSLAVPRASVVALLGPNGAGKTTTVEICEGYRRADSGTVRVLGLDPGRDHDALTPRVGVMLQSGGVYPNARALEMLRLMASFAATPLDVDDLVDRLGLGPVAKTPYRRLSGGEKQRLSLAMALVGRPELVFLDEPTAGMDPQARHATWDIIAALKADGVAILLTTHFMDEAEQLADQVVIIDSGTVVAAGSPAELTRRDSRGQVRFSAITGLPVDELAQALSEGCVVIEDRPGHYLVSGPVTPQTLVTLTAWCASHGAMLGSVDAGARSLEDVFLDLTGRELRA